MGKLTDKVALVTGGGTGLGRAIVKRFIAEGAKVGVLERVAEHATSLSHEFGEAVCVTEGDVRSYQDNQLAVDAVLKQFGRLDVFVGNAGIYDNRKRLSDFEPEDLSKGFDELYGINVKGYLLGVRASLAALRKTRGAVVLTASVSSQTAGFGGVLYISSKHAIVGVTRQLALELSPEVRVNAVAPGYIPTDLRGMDSLSQGPTGLSRDASELPLHLLPTADAYASYYVLLASEESRATATGTILLADGGVSLRGVGSVG